MLDLLARFILDHFKAIIKYNTNSNICNVNLPLNACSHIQPGGASVSLLLLTEETKGLFHRAIPQSGHAQCDSAFVSKEHVTKAHQEVFQSLGQCSCQLLLKSILYIYYILYICENILLIDDETYLCKVVALLLGFVTHWNCGCVSGNLSMSRYLLYCFDIAFPGCKGSSSEEIREFLQSLDVDTLLEKVDMATARLMPYIDGKLFKEPIATLLQ